MSEFDPKSPELHELASLPSGDPRRRGFEENLSAATPEELRFWQSVLRETDRIHSGLQNIELPPELQKRLMELPESVNGAARWKNSQKMRWSFPRLAVPVAALLLLAVGGYFYLFSAPRIATLTDSFAESIADQAVQFHEQNTPVQVAGTNIQTVQTELNQNKVPFPVVVLQPTGKLDLVGGGVCNISGTPAVYTRWKTGGQSDTLYQFDGRKIGVPALFYRRMEVPTSLWHGSHHYRVVIWPGDSGACTWALVLETESAKDMFSRAVY